MAGFAGLVALLYAVSIHSAAATSDKATTVLVGQAMADGHLLLHGWILPPGNYWTTDSALYAVLVRAFGLREGLLYSEPALVGALVVAVGVLIALEGRRGAAAVAGGTTVVALLAFAAPAMALWFVGKGFHVETALYALVAFVALRRGRFGWGWVAAVAVLAFGQLGDLELVAFASVPLALAGVVAMLRQRRWQSGLPEVTAALAGVVVGEVVLHVAERLGAFKPAAPLKLADHHQMLVNVVHLLGYGADLTGLRDGPFTNGGEPLGLLAVHAVGAVLMLACFVAALSGLVVGVVRGRPRHDDAARGPELWRLDDLLVVATFGSAAPFVLLAGQNGIGIHFVSIPVVFASVLTGRMVARAWPRLPAGRPARTVAAAGVVVVLGLAAGVGFELSRPTSVPPESALTAFLEAHHLHDGLAGYWTAASSTVMSDGAVVLRPVSIGALGGAYPMTSQSESSWYDGQRFQFFVSAATPRGRAALAPAVATWGRPTHVYIVGVYTVATWGHLLRVGPYPPT